MNRDDIYRLARDAFLMDKHDCSDDWFVRADIDEKNVVEFAALVVAAERKKLSGPIRIRIMSAAYDCADEGETESYNIVKVMCSDVLEMLNEP